MHDLKELGAWLSARGTEHEMLTPSSLPDPCFRLDGRELVSYCSLRHILLAVSGLSVNSGRFFISRP